MAFQKQVLQPCPRCKEPRLKTIESRSTNDVIRRRKQCTNCGKRVTTYEVSSDFYLLAQRNETVIQNINKMLGGHDISVDNKLTIKCTDCSYNINRKCSFEFPEYETIDSTDCNHYVYKKTI